MPSDGDAKESSTKKRVAMSAKEKKEGVGKKNSRDDTPAAKGDGSGEGDEAPAFTEGMKVRVRSAENEKEMLAATIVRVHRSGEVTVKYEESSEIEKNVKPSRVQRVRSSDKQQNSSLEVGDAVLYQPNPSDGGDEGGWRDGVVKTCRRDGTFDILDAASEEVVKKVASAAVKKAKKLKSKSRKNVDSASDADGHEERMLLAEDTSIEFKNEKGIWCSGRIHRVRKDGTFDVVHDDDDDETILKSVERKSIRKPKKKAKVKAGKGSKDGNEYENGSMRKRRASRKKGEQLSDDDDGSDSDSEQKASVRKRGFADAGVSQFAQLRINQLVQFPGRNGRIHRGRIKLLRKDDNACDVEHESDTETVSKRVPLDDVRPVSAFSSLLWKPTWMNQDPRVFQLNARVFYRTKDGFERKAVVVKIWKTSGKDTGPAYDIEDILDGNVVKKILGSKLRAVPWLNYSLPQMSGFGFNASLFSTVPRKGMNVRFRRRDSESGRVSWEEGVILRAKSDATCMIECVSAKGSKEQVQVKNGDIQMRFMPYFSNPLKDFLPSIELPKSMYAVGSSVEVSHGANIFLGSVLSSNEVEKTYTIVYSDGRKEKSVSADRVRLSLRKLRIGTEVEMIVEGPCKEVSKLDGEVAWVHRDEKVAVRINGGNNDVFAEVCSHALMVDGKPAFSAPLSSTWLELVGFYLNLTAEILVYMWLCFGMVVEMGEMIRLVEGTSSDVLEDSDYMTELYSKRHVDWNSCALRPRFQNGSAPHLLIPKQVIGADRSWLIVLLVLKAISTAGCALFGARLVHSKIMAIQDNFIDIREYQLDQVLRKHLGHVMGAAIIISYLTLIVYSSLLNRFEYYCLLQDAASIRFDDLALHLNMFSVHTVYDTSVDLLIGLAAKTTFNLFRAMALHVLIFAFPVSSTAFVKRILYLVPSVGLAALLSAMAVAALHAFYYVQKTEMVSNRVLTQTTDGDWSVVLVLVTIWFNASMYSILAASGRYLESLHERKLNSRGDVTDDILDQAERGEFGLQAKKEVRLTKVEQLQEQLGVCKLSVARLHSCIVLHLVAMILGIYADCTLRGSVQRHQSTGSTAVLQSMTFHVVVCILWLVTSVFSSLYALAIKQEPKVSELWNYLLDV